MTTMNEHLDSMTVQAATPDGTAFATLRGRNTVTVSFAPGYYAQTSEPRLEQKLSQLGKLLWVARMKEYYRFQSQRLGREVRGESTPRTPAQVARREARDAVRAEGTGGGVVRLSSVGMLHWTAQVEPGTLARVDEATFCAAVAQAAQQLIDEHVWEARLAWSAATAQARPGRPSVQ